MSIKILHLTLKKKWFDLIASGEKTVEYREYKDYWVKRLVDTSSGLKEFDEVHFTNGYGSGQPFMRVDVGSICVYTTKFIYPMNGEELIAERYFLIALGEVLETKNWRT